VPRTGEIGRRSEQVFLDGQRLTPVLRQDQLTNGSFYVKDASFRGASDFFNATKEVSVRGNNGLVEVFGNNVLVRGLNVQHAAGAGEGAFKLRAGTNLLLEQISIRDNNFGGLSLGEVNDITVRDSGFYDNGFTGNGGSRVDNLLYENVEAKGNNWRGELAGLTGWAVAGIKHLFTTNATYRDVNTSENRSDGFWLDTDNGSVVFERMTSSNNLRNGIYLEVNAGPVLIDDSEFNGNGYIGVRMSNQQNLTLTDSTIVGNEFQILLDQRSFQNYDNENFTLLRNIIGATEAGQELLRNNNFTPEGQNWIDFLNTLTADFNQYFHPTSDQQFPTEEEFLITFKDWQTVSGEEINSTFRFGNTIPEPATGLLLAAGLMGLSRRRRVAA
jgi:hypothetical protein